MRAEPFRVGLGRVGWVTIRSILGQIWSDPLRFDQFLVRSGQIRSDPVRFGNLQDRVMGAVRHWTYQNIS